MAGGVLCQWRPCILVFLGVVLAVLEVLLVVVLVVEVEGKFV